MTNIATRQEIHKESSVEPSGTTPAVHKNRPFFNSCNTHFAKFVHVHSLHCIQFALLVSSFEEFHWWPSALHYAKCRQLSWQLNDLDTVRLLPNISHLNNLSIHKNASSCFPTMIVWMSNAIRNPLGSIAEGPVMRARNPHLYKICTDCYIAIWKCSSLNSSVCKLRDITMWSSIWVFIIGMRWRY